MARLTGKLRDWLARVEILARGAEQHRADAVRALAAGQPALARHHALAILDELPRSRVALALWADAAEAMLLEDETREALERLSAEVPFRADVWYRLAQARHRTGAADISDALLRAVEAEEPSESADAALLWLAERDLAAGDPARAERWLERVSWGGRQLPEVRRCLAEARLDLDDLDGAVEAASGLDAPPVADGRGWLVHGRLLACRDRERAARAFERALLLRAPGAERVVSAFVEQGTPEQAARFSGLVESLGIGAHPRWRAAFAVAAGREAEAVQALAAGVRADPDVELLRRYASAAVDARMGAAVVEAVELAQARAVSLAPPLYALARALRATTVSARLDALDGAIAGPTATWAAELRRAAYAEWLPPERSAHWTPVLGEIEDVARDLGQASVVGQTEALARELQRPLRVAVVGEFNAGKSSFINALLGEDVAPVGVVPTTATINRLCWAPDRFVRIVLVGGEPDRIVAPADLRQTLAEVGAERVEEVMIYAPLEPLHRIELVDTPGFNSSHRVDDQTARDALGDAHVALWLLDATQPLKDSERGILRELASLGVPLVVLINKSDRLADDAAREDVLRHVEVALEEAALPVECPPIAFSARLAMRGIRGDSTASRASNWVAVEALVERLLVSRSTALRETALRRRAARIARQLAGIAEAREAQRAVAVRSVAEQRRCALALVGAVRSAREELVSTLERVAAAALAEFGREVQPVLNGLEAGERFVTLRARSTVGRRLGAATVEYCADRLGALPPDAATRCRERIELAAAVSAPWLLDDALAVLGGPATGSGADGGRRTRSAVQRIVRAAVDELAAAAEAAVLDVVEPPPDRAGARVLALSAVLALTFKS